MLADIESILITETQISARVTALARSIAADLVTLPREDEIVFMPIMNGSIVFAADLMRQLPLKMRFRVAMISSYPGTSTTSRGPHIVGSLPEDLRGCHMLLVDDILDSGQTLQLLRSEMQQRGAVSIRACVLLRKRLATTTSEAQSCEYVGFEIPDCFVVGYGLDYDDYYRNLPHIGILKPPPFEVPA
ncbi:MAG: phosphoribosyltransferase [Phycisphaerales bacterium]